MSEILDTPKKKRRTLLGALRTYFFTGLVVTAPIYITFYLMLWFVEFLDGYFRPWIPEIYWPTTYLPVDVPGVAWSDHWSFWQEGYPAVMVTDTAPYRYPHYHKASDTMDKIDFENFTKAVEGFEAVVRRLANP